ncbi:MAG: hypothetical protein KGJ98_06250 [Chloroflexota bacterium]|nr:hypothetical protein [Chloroflexota bacterium]MDE3101823.1 hypothetical protein [Chloroflexota bacterium]
MSMRPPRLELRAGARVRWQPVHTDEWREGKLIRPMPNNEEWLVENEAGRFWIHVTRLRPAEEHP